MGKNLSVGVLFLILATFSFAQPPLPPSFMTNDEKGEAPESCKSIPPMLLHFPPKLEQDLYKCQNDYFAPKKEVLEDHLKRLLKKEVSVTSISPLEGFKRFYKVIYLEDGKQNSIFSNEDGTKFIIGALVE